MIKNYRPYTDENGSIDAALITDSTPTEQYEAAQWIKNNIRPSRRILRGRSSYGLKHDFHRDTQIYLTNNQFKDAMMLCGYYPIDPNELNWHYRIALVSDIDVNPNPFRKWVIKKYLSAYTPEGDFARDAKDDKEFPVFGEYKTIMQYLDFVNACDDAVKVFKKLWKEYCNERKAN